VPVLATWPLGPGTESGMVTCTAVDLVAVLEPGAVEYSVALSLAWLEIHKGEVGDSELPHGFFRLGSVTGAMPGTSEARSTWFNVTSPVAGRGGRCSAGHSRAAAPDCDLNSRKPRSMRRERVQPRLRLRPARSQREANEVVGTSHILLELRQLQQRCAIAPVWIAQILTLGTPSARGYPQRLPVLIPELIVTVLVGLEKMVRRGSRRLL